MGHLKSLMHIGWKPDRSPFSLPVDLSDRKIAMLAQSKKGKTYGLGVLLEEMIEGQQPFIAVDPASNLWGLRVLPDGSPSGYEVVVIGGNHADLPFEKDQGERVAELLLATPICAVIDITSEMPGAIRTFMTAFAGRLMRTKPDVGRVLFLEEGQELIPQSPMGIQARICRDVVAKIAVIGGNFGYGVVVASQRAATIDKNVLSQCEALIVMGMTHEKDRDTVKGWIDAKDEDGKAIEAFNTLGSLAPGEAWIWWPGENRFERFTFRKRKTLHPREMRKLGLKSGSIKLGDMTTFVERARRELTKTSVAVPEGPRKKQEYVPGPIKLVPDEGISKLTVEIEELTKKVEDLHRELAVQRSARVDAERRLETVREQLRPQYDALRGLFEQLGSTPTGSSVDRTKYLKWLAKAPKVGMKTMLEHLIENGEATRQELAAIAGVARTTSYDYIGWILRAQLAEDDGKKIVLRRI